MRGRAKGLMTDARRRRGCGRAAACLGLFLCLSWGRTGEGQAVIQGLAVSPVTIEMQAGQRTAVLTVQNHSDADAAFQVRPFAWDQAQGLDTLQPTDDVLVSPPLGRLPVGASQVVRLVLRRPADGREASYRVWLDQIPPPASPGKVAFSLRLSIPVFVEPAGRIAARVRWSVEQRGAELVLAGVNEGTRRQVVRQVVLNAPDGARFGLEANVSPYILAGATRRWRILSEGPPPSPGETLRLTARADTGDVDQGVPVVRAGS